MDIFHGCMATCHDELIKSRSGAKAGWRGIRWGVIGRGKTRMIRLSIPADDRGVDFAMLVTNPCHE